MARAKCRCKTLPPFPAATFEDAGSTLVEIVGCDFCGDTTAEPVESIGDKVACVKCLAPDEDGLTCDCCGNPLRLLDDGGTLVGRQTWCERCWVWC